MKTRDLLNLLAEHQDKSLLFEYSKDAYVGANYHITEVKNVTVDSVDCGSGTDYWKETVIQLWESPEELDKTEFMTVSKALAILDKVNGIKPMDPGAEIKFEYSNNHFHTAQLFVDDYAYTENRLLLKLAINKTDCKARENCGAPQEELKSEPCCGPETQCC